MAFERTIERLMSKAKPADVAKTLRAEIADKEQAAFEARLEELNAEADRRRAAEAEAAAAEAAEVQRLADLETAEAEMVEAAREMEQALADLGRTFVRLDEAESEVGRLDPNRRSDVLKRRWVLTRALWHHARPLCMRLKLASPPGGPSKNAPLVDALRLHEVEDA